MVIPVTTVLPDTGTRTNSPYPAAIAMASFSLLSIILIFPALFQHYRNRNVGATVLVACAVCANLMTTTNALVWSDDNIPNWYRGVGLCDIQVKLIVMLSNCMPASISCILRALANVMDTNRVAWTQTLSQKRRGYIIDLICCVGIPAVIMALSYINQVIRYAIIGISGCMFQKDLSWLAFIILILPPLLWTLLGVYYAVLILVRLIRYRRSFSAVLANSNTTKSRFIRLYSVCVLVILGQLPISVYIVIVNLRLGIHPFSWNMTHHNPQLPWNSVILAPSYGTIYYDRIVWLVGSYLVFFFFGFGKDAMKVYSDMLLVTGLGRLFSALRPENQRIETISGTISSFGSKAKLFMKRRGSNATSANLTTSTSSTDTSSPSPKTTTFLESIKENQQLPTPVTSKQQKANSLLAGFTSIFRKKQERSPVNQETFIAATNTSFLATVSAEPMSPTAAHARDDNGGRYDVLFMKEIRQASETADTLPSKMYEGV